MQGDWDDENITTIRDKDVTTDLLHLMDIPYDKAHVGDFVRLASFITGAARARLGACIDTAQPSNVFYCDTDSIFLTTEGLRLIQAELDAPGEEKLGKFKIESFNDRPGKFVKAVFAGRKCYALQDETGAILFKAKGVNWRVGVKMTTDDKRRIFDALYTAVVRECAANEHTFKPKIQLFVEVTCNRWLWDTNRTGVVVEEYFKEINMCPKRAFLERGYTRPLTYD